MKHIGKNSFNKDKLKSIFSGKNINYKPPEDKMQLLYDFYFTSYMFAAKEDYKRDDGFFEIVQSIKDQLASYLKERVLNDLYMVIATEFRHVFKLQEPKGIIELHKPLSKHQRFFEEYQKILHKEEEKEMQSGQSLDSLVERNDPLYQQGIRKRGYKTGIEALNQILEMYGASKEKLISFLGKIFSLDDKFADFSVGEGEDPYAQIPVSERVWDENYGGRAWANICQGWLMLNRANSTNEKIIALDHIFDLQHNTGVVFNKLATWAKPIEGEVRSTGQYDFEWMKMALDHKKQITNPYDLLQFCSPQMKVIGNRYVHDIYGTSLSENENPLDFWIKTITKNESLLEDSTLKDIVLLPDNIIKEILEKELIPKDRLILSLKNSTVIFCYNAFIKNVINYDEFIDCVSAILVEHAYPPLMFSFDKLLGEYRHDILETCLYKIESKSDNEKVLYLSFIYKLIRRTGEEQFKDISKNVIEQIAGLKIIDTNLSFILKETISKIADKNEVYNIFNKLIENPKRTINENYGLVDASVINNLFNILSMYPEYINSNKDKVFSFFYKSLEIVASSGVLAKNKNLNVYNFIVENIDEKSIIEELRHEYNIFENLIGLDGILAKIVNNTISQASSKAILAEIIKIFDHNLWNRLIGLSKVYPLSQVDANYKIKEQVYYEIYQAVITTVTTNQSLGEFVANFFFNINLNKIKRLQSNYIETKDLPPVPVQPQGGVPQNQQLQQIPTTVYDINNPTVINNLQEKSETD